jgi:hypothetical protein
MAAFPIAGAEVPGDLGTAVRVELAQARRPPYTTLGVVTANGLFMTLAWYFVPVGLQDLFFTVHGQLAFPMVLAAWMLSDVPATNVLGVDPVRSAAALDDRDALLRLLYAKNIVLWALVVPVATTLAVVLGAVTGQWTACLLTAAWIVLVPIGALGVSAWLGILWPYHPQPLRWRWERRHEFRHMIVRWLTLAIAPWFLVSGIAAVVMLPGLAMWAAFSDGELDARIPDGRFALIVLVSAVVAAAVFFGGHRIGVRIAQRRRDALRAYLADPELG